MSDDGVAEVRPLTAWPDLALIWLFTLALPTLGSALFVLQRRTALVLEDRRLIGTVILELVGLCAVAAYLKARGQLGAVPLIRPSWVATGLGLGLVITVWVAYYVCAWTLILASGTSLLLAHGLHVVHRCSLSTILAMCIVNPLFEELIVVAAVMRVLEPRGARVAILASVALRVSYHLYQGWLAVAFTLPLGVMFAAFYWKKRDLWPLLVAHALLDFLPMISHR